MQKRVTAPIREPPPRNEQFLLDFQQLQGQFQVSIVSAFIYLEQRSHSGAKFLNILLFQDQEQLRAVTESVLISFVVQCSGHGPQSEFILFALRSLCSVGYVKWDTFLLSLLSTVSSAEASVGPGSPTMAGPMMMSPSSSSHVPNTTNFQTSNPTSPLPSMHGIGSPAQSATDQSIAATLSPVKPSDFAGSGQNSTLRAHQSLRVTTISSLRQLVCKIVLVSLESNLKPVTHFEVFSHMINWLVNWDQKQQGSDEPDAVRAWKPERPLHEWMHICLDVIWRLVEEDKCRIPFYELIRSALQYMDNIPDDEALFSIILEIHRRRDLVATHMQMLDQHLHCPTFATHRFLPQSYPNIPSDSISNLRYSPITYPSVLGEPLHGEVIQLIIALFIVFVSLRIK